MFMAPRTGYALIRVARQSLRGASTVANVLYESFFTGPCVNLEGDYYRP